MTSINEQYEASKKKIWLFYKIAIIALVIFLVTVVASDNEEIFFYSIMTIGASYAFRPNDHQINYLVKRFYGVDPPVSVEESSGQDDT